MFGIGNSVVVGYDISTKYAQISYMAKGDDMPKTISAKDGVEQFNIPVCLFKRLEVNQWFYGEDAISYSEMEEGQLVDNLWERALVGEKVVVVEDLISTGGSVIDVVDALREAGAEVLGIVSIFTYGMKRGLERLASAQVENHSLTDFDCIARVAADEGYIRPEDVERLLRFRDNPSDESWIGGKA